MKKGLLIICLFTILEILILSGHFNISEKRLGNMHQMMGDFEITNLKNENGSASGTNVPHTIPYEFN